MASEAITPVTTRTVASSCKKCSLMTLCVILGLLSLFLALLLILVIVIFSSGSVRFSRFKLDNICCIFKVHNDARSVQNVRLHFLALSHQAEYQVLSNM